MRQNLLLKTIIPALVLFTLGCTDFSKETDINFDGQEYELAVPLIHSNITVAELANSSDGNTSIKIDGDGKATVLYNGQVIRQESSAIFPAYPGVLPVEIYDTLWNFKLPFKAEYKVDKAVFQSTSVSFSFINTIAQDVKIKMRILELTKNGKQFEQDFLLKYDNKLPVEWTSEKISIDGWQLESADNSLTFHYDAVLPDGSKIKLDRAFMQYDLIKFSYIEGYLGYQEFPINGSVIDIGLFNAWKSGTFDFEDPKISISVDNSFGIPVRSKVNKMQLTSISGNQLDLQSVYIDTGIDFAFPSFSEIDQVKTTNFVFDKNNSNIREIFNEKTKSIVYDIVALVNPDKDTSIKGYVTDESYFTVNVAVEVPLLGSVNQLVLSDTLDIDLQDSKDIQSAEFKLLTTNDFPADVALQAYFIDQNGNQVDQLFDGDGLVLPAASLLSNGKTNPGSEITNFINFDKTRFDKIKDSKRLMLVGKINTTGSDQKNSLWIYDDYGIEVKLGAIFKYIKN